MDDTVDSRVGKPVFTNRLSCHLPRFVILLQLIPFAIGDLFIFGSITGVIVYPFMPVSARNCRGKGFCYVTGNICYGFTYGSTSRGVKLFAAKLLPAYAYSLYSLHTGDFQEFVDNYIDSLNSSFVPVKGIHEKQVRDEAVKLYNQLSDSLGVHRPPFPNPRVKTMVFTPFISMVGGREAWGLSSANSP